MGIRHVRAQMTINRFHHPASRREVSSQQVEGDGIATGKGRHHFPLDGGAIGNPANAGNVYGNPRTIGALGTETTHHQATLSHGIDLIVGPL